MTINQRFAVGMLGAGMVCVDAFANFPTPIGILLGTLGGTLAGWQAAALWMTGNRR